MFLDGILGISFIESRWESVKTAPLIANHHAVLALLRDFLVNSSDFN